MGLLSISKKSKKLFQQLTKIQFLQFFNKFVFHFIFLILMLQLLLFTILFQFALENYNLSKKQQLEKREELMKYQLTLILVVFSFFLLGKGLLIPTSYDMSSVIGLTTDEAIKVLAGEQQERYEKCLRHFLTDFSKQLKQQNLSREQVNRKIYQKVHSIHVLWLDLKTYMINKVFHKLGMNDLGGIFQDEIKQNPEEYFLTFEMYDLLFD